MGTTLAIFSNSGTSPVLNERLKICANGNAILLQISFNIFEENSVLQSVRPSVSPSVCQTRGLQQNGRKICPDLYTIRKII